MNENEEIKDTDPFEGLGFSFDEAKEDLADRSDIGRAGKDSRICICGHPVKRHKFKDFLGYYQCLPNAQVCPCRNPEPVAKTSDLRMFLRSTRGEGHLHALGQGIVAAATNGAKFEWTIEKKCFICKQEKPVIPVAINERGYPMEKATQMNILICGDCNSY
jgi:hypothetical protein